MTVRIQNRYEIGTNSVRYHISYEGRQILCGVPAEDVAEWSHVQDGRESMQRLTGLDREAWARITIKEGDGVPSRTLLRTRPLFE